MVRYLFILCCTFPLSLHAHYIPSLETPIVVNASIVATWRSHDVVADYDYWQIPGTLMGGDAWPTEKGVQLDDVNLGLGVRVDKNSYAVVELGSHTSGNDDHSAVDVEHAYLGFVCCEEKGPWVLEAGRMSALFSPSLSEHSADRLASESPLVNDVFFGRDFHDDGVRFLWHSDTIISGVEAWKGNAFPATSSGGHAWDVFARYIWKSEEFSVTGGAWFYQSSAETRADHRYGGSHQHTPVAPPGSTFTPFPDTRFTGDNDIYGVHADISYTANKDWQFGFKTELMEMHAEGELHDAVGRVADLDAQQLGVWVQPYMTWQAHTFAIRGEWLTTDNDITGAAANQLSRDAGLDNPSGLEPSRYTAIWRWQWRKNIAFRTELVDDKSLPDENLRAGIGVVWQQAIWPFNSNKHKH